MTNFKNVMHRQMYAEAYARHQEGLRLGLQLLADQRTFPSTDPTSTEGERGCRSPLGTGVAQPKER
jgi:hypothetical protein